MHVQHKPPGRKSAVDEISRFAQPDGRTIPAVACAAAVRTVNRIFAVLRPEPSLAALAVQSAHHETFRDYQEKAFPDQSFRHQQEAERSRRKEQHGYADQGPEHGVAVDEETEARKAGSRHEHAD